MTNSKFSKLLIVLLLLSTIIVSACKKEDVSQYDCTGTTPSYTAVIKPILDANCAVSGCHNASSSKSGVNLSTFEDSKKVAGESQFLGSIQHKKGYSKMPKGGSKLSESDIKLLSCWVQNGMPN